MPFCPACKYEYVEGIKRCPDCDVDLVDQLDDILGKSIAEEELEFIFQTSNRMEATVIADMLNASGIEVLEQPGVAFYGRLLDSAQEIRLYVLKSQADDARKLIEETPMDVN